jgi:hypothetical protein
MSKVKRRSGATNTPGKTEIVKWRTTKQKKNRLIGLAKMYAQGNLSRWLEYVTESYNPKFLKENRALKK